MNKPPATASVTIVTYNSESDIGPCLEAVLTQTHPVERIVVVDNASSDGTCGIVRRFDGPVTLLVNEMNIGFAPGHNQAIAHTKSDYVLVLNPDVILEPDYLSVILHYMEAHREIGSAAGRLVFAADPDVIDTTGLVMDAFRRARDRGTGEPAANWLQSGEVFGVSGAAAVYARRMIDDIRIDGQFFDEAYFAYKEDVDVAWRARLLGWKAYYAADARALHHRGWKYEGRASRKSKPLFLRRHSYQNRIYTMVKNEPAGWRLLLRLPALIGMELAMTGYAAVFEPGLLGCWAAIARTLPQMLRKRRILYRRIHDRNGSS
ncbi:glycosyltransferase family 2 protein [Paenibacillus humicola]|uniref:glycosyltransferase family 2 protein n=1 Tax=Paenibacillus humicola TaxID=3110540 RepID=UPI00237B4DE5|nr:glycosyltransferase family 2 protein [Paenibacillus humicola]